MTITITAGAQVFQLLHIHPILFGVLAAGLIIRFLWRKARPAL